MRNTNDLRMFHNVPSPCFLLKPTILMIPPRLRPRLHGTQRSNHEEKAVSLAKAGPMNIPVPMSAHQASKLSGPLHRDCQQIQKVWGFRHAIRSYSSVIRKIIWPSYAQLPLPIVHGSMAAKVQGKNVSSPGSRHVAVGQPCNWQMAFGHSNLKRTQDLYKNNPKNAMELMFTMFDHFCSLITLHLVLTCFYILYRLLRHFRFFLWRASSASQPTSKVPSQCRNGPTSLIAQGATPEEKAAAHGRNCHRFIVKASPSNPQGDHAVKRCDGFWWISAASKTSSTSKCLENIRKCQLTQLRVIFQDNLDWIILNPCNRFLPKVRCTLVDDLR